MKQLTKPSTLSTIVTVSLASSLSACQINAVTAQPQTPINSQQVKEIKMDTETMQKAALAKLNSYDAQALWIKIIEVAALRRDKFTLDAIERIFAVEFPIKKCYDDFVMEDVKKCKKMSGAIYGITKNDLSLIVTITDTLIDFNLGWQEHYKFTGAQFTPPIKINVENAVTDLLQNKWIIGKDFSPHKNYGVLQDMSFGYDTNDKSTHGIVLKYNFEKKFINDIVITLSNFGAY